MTASKISKGLLLGLALLLATASLLLIASPRQLVSALRGQPSERQKAPAARLRQQDGCSQVGEQIRAGHRERQHEGRGERDGEQQRADQRGHERRGGELARSHSCDPTLDDDGHKSLTEIRFSGKKYALAIGSESAKAESSDGGK